MAEQNKNDKKKPLVPKKKAVAEPKGDDVFQPPVIVREPSSRQAKLGSNVVLRVQATGRPLPSYQWFHNGKKIAGANSDRLTLNKVRRANAGSYHCEAKNFVGKATSRACMLSFFLQKIPKLVIGPALSRLDETQIFSLKVVSPPVHELKEFKIYWSFNGMRIRGASGPELLIGAAKKKYEGEYKAMIAVGSGIETSNVARLEVIPADAKGSSLRSMLEDAPANPIARSSSPPAAGSAVAKSSPPPTGSDSSSWENFLFNPEDDESNSAEAGDAQEKINPSASPLSQMGTGKLIRELAMLDSQSAQGEENRLPSEATSAAPDSTDLSALFSSSASDVQLPQKDEISALIENLEARREPKTNREATFTEPPVQENQTSSSSTAEPELDRKKQFLEKLLNRVQSKNTPGSRKQAA